MTVLQKGFGCRMWAQALRPSRVRLAVARLLCLRRPSMESCRGRRGRSSLISHLHQKTIRLSSTAPAYHRRLRHENGTRNANIRLLGLESGPIQVLLRIFKVLEERLVDGILLYQSRRNHLPIQVAMGAQHPPPPSLLRQLCRMCLRVRLNSHFLHRMEWKDTLLICLYHRRHQGFLHNHSRKLNRNHSSHNLLLLLRATPHTPFSHRVPLGLSTSRRGCTILAHMGLSQVNNRPRVRFMSRTSRLCPRPRRRKGFAR
jgi:hypothetical protein